jgi:hypothetical protein
MIFTYGFEIFAVVAPYDGLNRSLMAKIGWSEALGSSNLNGIFTKIGI